MHDHLRRSDQRLQRARSAARRLLAGAPQPGDDRLVTTTGLLVVAPSVARVLDLDADQHRRLCVQRVEAALTTLTTTEVDALWATFVGGKPVDAAARPLARLLDALAAA